MVDMCSRDKGRSMEKPQVTVTYVPPLDHPVHYTRIAHEQLLLSTAFKKVPVVRRIMQNVHTLLNLWIVYITYQGEIKVSHGIKDQLTSRWRGDPGSSRGPHVITWVLVNGKGSRRERTRELASWETLQAIADFEMQECREPRNEGSL